MMKILIRAITILSAVTCMVNASAQSATGSSATSCTQSGTVITCTTATTMNLPSGVNLQSGSNLTQFGLSGSATGPACTGLTANPSTVAAGGGTPVTLTVSCPSGSYIYTWAPPAAAASGAATSATPNLSTTTPSITYSVSVCFASATTSCNTYTTAVSLTATTPPLTSCTVSATAVNISTGATPTLTASCQQGTGPNTGTTYSWTRNGIAIGGAIGQTYQLTTTDTASAGTVTYAVNIANNSGSTANASIAITATTAVVVGDSCPNTPVRATLDASSAYSRFISSNYVGNFTAGDNFVIQLNVAGSDTTGGGRQVVLMNFSDIGASRGGRYVTISRNKCDYTSTAQWVSGYLNGVATPQNSASKTISLNDPAGPGPLRLTSGTWYINVQNVIGSCASNVSCHVVLDWAN